MDKKLSIRDRVKVLVTGETKSYIPSLDSIDTGSGSIPLTTIDTKPEQLRTNLGWVYAANSAIVDDVAACEPKLRKIKKVKKKDGTVEVEYEPILEHDILKLINKPHSALNGTQFRKLWHTYRNLVGETYALMVKDGRPYEVSGELPHALQLLPAHLTEFKLGREAYSASTIRYGQTTYKLNEVLRDFEPDPSDPFARGRSIVAAAAASVDLDQQMQGWNRRMFANNARPGLIFNLQGEKIDGEVYERIKQQMSELYTKSGAFKSLVVENGEVKPYMLSAQDLDFLNSRAFTRDEILAMFKVPSSVLGMSQDYNRANIDGSRYIHMLINVWPRLQAEAAMWNSQLVQKIDKTLELYFDNPTPQDEAAELKAASEGVNKWMTIDEVREDRGLEALPGKLGEQLIVPVNSIPLNQLMATPDSASDTTDDTDTTNEPPKDDEDSQDASTEGKKSLPKPRTWAARTVANGR